MLATLPNLLEPLAAVVRPLDEWGAWGIAVSAQEAPARTPHWLYETFAKISALESGNNVPGLGNFRASAEASNQLRLYVNAVPQHLPKPAVIPLSGQGIMLRWESGTKAVEVTAFANGELYQEAMLNGDVDESLERANSRTLLAWLVSA